MLYDITHKNVHSFWEKSVELIEKDPIINRFSQSIFQITVSLYRWKEWLETRVRDCVNFVILTSVNQYTELFLNESFLINSEPAADSFITQYGVSFKGAGNQ